VPLACPLQPPTTFPCHSNHLQLSLVGILDCLRCDMSVEYLITSGGTIIAAEKPIPAPTA
jgi:hypothetical protein